MFRILTLAYLMGLACVALGFPYATSRQDINVDTASTSDWDAFLWKWNNRDYQQVDITFTSAFSMQDVSEVWFRLAYPERGPYYLEVRSGGVTFSTNNTARYQWSELLAPTNIPPPRMYYAEMLAIAVDGTTRTLAKGKVQTEWSIFSTTNAAEWTPVVVVMDSAKVYLEAGAGVAINAVTSGLSVTYFISAGTNVSLLLSAYSNDVPFMTSSNLSDYNNDAGFITEAGASGLNATNLPSPGQMLYASDNTKTNLFFANPPASASTNLSDYNNDVPFLETESDPVASLLITQHATNQMNPHKVTAAQIGAATGVPLYEYIETDPVWTAEKGNYATGMPVYVEVDPVWSGWLASNGLPLLAADGGALGQVASNAYVTATNAEAQAQSAQATAGGAFAEATNALSGANAAYATATNAGFMASEAASFAGGVGASLSNSVSILSTQKVSYADPVYTNVVALAVSALQEEVDPSSAGLSNMIHVVGGMASNSASAISNVQTFAIGVGGVASNAQAYAEGIGGVVSNLVIPDLSFLSNSVSDVWEFAEGVGVTVSNLVIPALGALSNSVSVVGGVASNAQVFAEGVGVVVSNLVIPDLSALSNGVVEVGLVVTNAAQGVVAVGAVASNALARSGGTMSGAISNEHGYYGDGSGLTNLAAKTVTWTYTGSNYVDTNIVIISAFDEEMYGLPDPDILRDPVFIRGENPYDGVIYTNSFGDRFIYNGGWYIWILEFMGLPSIWTGGGGVLAPELYFNEVTMGYGSTGVLSAVYATVTNIHTWEAGYNPISENWQVAYDGQAVQEWESDKIKISVPIQMAPNISYSSGVLNGTNGIYWMVGTNEYWILFPEPEAP